MEMMDMAADDNREELRRKLRSNFDGRIVRKDLTKKIKEGANVPVYVLEFLLGQYCSSDDETIIEQGVQNVKRILADNFVRPDEAQKILSQLRKNGSHTIIDVVKPKLGEHQPNNPKLVYTMDFQVTPHQLRHTYITNLIYASVDPKTVQYLAGHENSKVTMDIYAKVKYNKPAQLHGVINRAIDTSKKD